MRRDMDDTPFSEADIARMGPVRPEIALISDYLANDLSPEAKAEVERRLVDEPEFAEAVWPTITLWQMTHHVRVQRARALQKAERERQRPGSGPGRTVVEQMKKLRKAAALIVVGAGTLTVATTIVVQLTTPPRVTAQAFLTVDGTSLPVQYDKKYTPRTGDSTERIPRTMIRTVQHASAPAAPAAPAGPQRLDRAPVIGIKNGTEVETGPDETMVFSLGEHGRVVLSPNSRFTWTLTMAFFPWSNRNVVAALDGEATIEPDNGTAVTLWTSAGKASVSRGASALRCEPGCEAMLVSVKTGFVALLGTGRGNMLTVRASQWGRLPKGGKPAQDPEGKGFPVVAPRKP